MSIKKNLFYLWTCLVGIVLLFSFQPANAVNVGDLYKIDGDRPVKDVFPDIGTLVAVIVTNSFIIAGVVLLFLIILAGLRLVSGAGNPEEMQKGRQGLTNALIGFIIVLASYWIVEVIEIVTGLNLLDLSGL